MKIPRFLPFFFCFHCFVGREMQTVAECGISSRTIRFAPTCSRKRGPRTYAPQVRLTLGTILLSYVGTGYCWSRFRGEALLHRTEGCSDSRWASVRGWLKHALNGLGRGLPQGPLQAETYARTSPVPPPPSMSVLRCSPGCPGALQCKACRRIRWLGVQKPRLLRLGILATNDHIMTGQLLSFVPS